MEVEEDEVVNAGGRQSSTLNLTDLEESQERLQWITSLF